MYILLMERRESILKKDWSWNESSRVKELEEVYLR